MVHADSSLRTSIPVVSPYDVYEPSAQTLDDIEPVYNERSYVSDYATPKAESGHKGKNVSLPAHIEAAAAVPVLTEAPAPQVVAPLTEMSAKPMRKAVVAKPTQPANALPGSTKPPRVGVNIEWVQKGVGWDCREVYYVGKQRRRRHLGHIGRQKWEDMQQQFKGSELEYVLSEWIEERRAEKSLSLNNETAAE